MTVPSATNKSGPYSGNGVTTVFAYGFRILDATHIQVVTTTAGVDTIADPGDYSVSSVGNTSGGNITFTTAPATGTTVNLIRNAPFTQGVDLENQGAYYAETIEQALDLAVMRDQQMAEQIGRSVKLPVGAEGSFDADELVANLLFLGDLYLGAKASPPALDNEGNALTTGTTYWDTASSQMFTWSGSEWKPTFLTGNTVRSLVTATSGQTVVTTPTYVVGVNSLSVYVNGVKVLLTDDYVETNQNTITFTSGLTASDEVELIALQAFPIGTTGAESVNTVYGVTVARLLALREGTVAELLADTTLDPAEVPVGSVIEAGGFRYEVAASGAADEDVTTAGGVKLYVQADADGAFSVGAFGATGDGATDDTAAILAAFAKAATIPAAFSAGCHIVFPQGVYLLTSTINLDNMSFSKVTFNGATIKAGANNLTVFQSNTSAFGVKIDDPKINGNGFTGVTAFDMTRMDQLGAGIYRPVIRNCAIGIFLRSLCTGCHIQDPDINTVNEPIIVLDGSGGIQISHPRIDGYGPAGIDVRLSATFENVGVQIVGGYIQNGVIGVKDAGVNTQVIGTYFEGNSEADVSLVSNSQYFYAYGTNHTSTSAGYAYKGRSADAAYIANPFMSSAARTGLFDFDATNTNCVRDVLFGGGSKNIPVGTTTGIALSVPKFSEGTFTPTIRGSGTAGTATYSEQIGKWQKLGNRVMIDVKIAWTGHTGAGAMQIDSIPADLEIIQDLYGTAVGMGMAFTGPLIRIVPPAIGGANLQFNIQQISTAGVASFVPFAAAGNVVAHMEYIST